jgi:2-methylcitrate dehydratase PrpD
MSTVAAESRSLSQHLARFAYDLRLDDLPADVLEHVRLLVLDVVGLCLAAVGEEFAAAVLGVVQEMGGRSESRPVGLDVAMPAPSAALVSGTLTHGHDFDDSHAGSLIHTSGSIVPTALAVGEARRTSGREVLEAVAAGLEVNARLGLAVGDGFHRRGFHPTSVCGTLAASQVAGRLMGMDAAALAQAMGIAGSMASGIREAYLGGGTWTKRLHPGWAAHAGILAARLASRGFSGPLQVLEGRYGLYNAMVGPGGWDSRPALRGLGQDWEIRRIGFKPYPCGVVIHPFLDALRTLMAEHRLVAAAIEGIHCSIAPGALQTVCEPVEEKLEPATDYQAKFSLQFCLAALALRGDVTLDTFQPAAVRDPDILALARRVSFEADPSQPYPRQYTARLAVTTRDGRRLRRAESATRGSLERPMTAQEVQAKFWSNARRALLEARIDALEEQVLRLETLPDVTALLDLAAGERSPLNV